MVRTRVQIRFAISYRCLIVLLALFMSACVSPAAQPAATSEQLTPTRFLQESARGSAGKLRLLLWRPPTNLNPYLTSSLDNFQASRITYEPLASFDKDGRLIPFLAAEIPSTENGGIASDGMAVTWKLKQDVRWADGAPFTAADVAFTYEFITNPAISSHAAVAYDAVKNVEILDDYTLRVNFKTPHSDWATPFVGWYGLILPRHLFHDYNGANYLDAPANMVPVGTGPYYVISFRPQEVLFLNDRLVQTNKVVYQPNPYFREPDHPAFSGVELRGWGLPDLSARSVLESGTADYVYDLQLSSTELQQMEAQGRGTATDNFGSKLLLLELNATDPNRGSSDTPHPLMSDNRIRQAIAHAIDRESIARSIYAEFGRPITNILIAPDQYQSPNSGYEFDLAKAAALLDAAGWVDTNGDSIRDKNGNRLRVTYQFGQGPLLQQIPEIIKQSLESIGFEVELKLVNASIFLSGDASNPDTRERFSADLQQYYVSNAAPDPRPYLAAWTCEKIPTPDNNWHGSNTARWCNPAYDALYEQSLTEADATQRQQLVIQMNDTLVKDSFMIPIVQVADVSGVSNAIQGIEWTPWDAEVWNIKDWRKQLSP